MAETGDGITVGVGADIAPLRGALSEASRLSGKFAGDLTRAFEDAALKGRTLSDVLKQLAFSLSRQTLEAALSPITSLFGSGLSGLLGGLGGVTPPIARHAQGGVIASPIAFPLSGRRLGLAGEAGPEAILPLTRGHDGRLGVRAQGAANALNITRDGAGRAKLPPLRGADRGDVLPRRRTWPATIAVTFSSGALNCFIAVYRLTGHASGTPFATGSDVTDPINISINVPAGGVAVSGVALYRGAGTGDNTWTGLTEDVDASLSETTYDAGSASASFIAAQTPLAIQCAHGATPNAMAGVAASW
jgi:hypothetical protein